MNQYRFTLNNYHSISCAEIELDGITVIAGCNGCGKSTIARWLYALINYSNEFNSLVDRKLTQSFNQQINRMRRILGNLDSENSQKASRLRPISESVLKKGIDSIFADNSTEYSRLLSAFEDKVEQFRPLLIDDLELHLHNPDYIDWLKKTLGQEDSNVNGFIDDYCDLVIKNAVALSGKSEKAKQDRILSLLFDFIKEEMDLSGNLPEEIGLNENGRDLVSKDRFLVPLELHNAVYVDTPMALSNYFSWDNNIWEKLKYAMATPRQPMPESARKLALRIKKIIGGDIVVDTDEISPELRYRRKEDNLYIPVYEAATGLKTFAYMLRLIENGYLTENSILIIDEPEAHLHPQWIVEFARVLVLLNKEIGCKVMLASHNPDMIAAIRSISSAQGTLAATRFYQAEKDPDSLRYTYKNLGSDIEEIFRSFNIALERIKDYGD